MRWQRESNDACIGLVLLTCQVRMKIAVAIPLFMPENTWLVMPSLRRNGSPSCTLGSLGM